MPHTVAGLSGQEAALRLREAGYNELPSSIPRSLWRIAGDMLREPTLFQFSTLHPFDIGLGAGVAGRAWFEAVKRFEPPRYFWLAVKA